jgi:hypothetical protein
VYSFLSPWPDAAQADIGDFAAAAAALLNSSSSSSSALDLAILRSIFVWSHSRFFQ